MSQLIGLRVIVCGVKRPAGTLGLLVAIALWGAGHIALWFTPVGALVTRARLADRVAQCVFCLVRKNNELNPMGNTHTGSGSGEPGHPSVLSHEEVRSEKDRLLTRSLNTSAKPSGTMAVDSYA